MKIQGYRNIPVTESTSMNSSQWTRRCILTTLIIANMIIAFSLYEYMFLSYESKTSNNPIKLPERVRECYEEELFIAQENNKVLLQEIVKISENITPKEFQDTVTKLPKLTNMSVWPPPRSMKVDVGTIVFVPMIRFEEIHGNLPREIWEAHQPWLFPHPASLSIPHDAEHVARRWELRSDVVVQTPHEGVVPDGHNERYELHVNDTGVFMTASSTFGLMRGLTTLAQLIQWDPYPGWGLRIGRLPGLSIQDEPRFGLRSFLVDPPRVFFTVKELKTVVDVLALQKMNALHLRLSDEHHFRVALLESFPALSHEEMNIYSISQLHDIVDYAFLRGIRIIPEIDVPGHAKVFERIHMQGLVFNCSREEWSHNLDPRRDEVYIMMKRVLHELIPIFPDPLFHLGHDEVSKDCWDASLLETLGTSPGARMSRSNLDKLRKEMMIMWSTKMQNMLWNSNDDILESKRYIYWGDMFKWLKPEDVVSVPYVAEHCIWEPWIRDTTAQLMVDTGYDIIYGNFFWTYLDQLFQKRKDVHVSDVVFHWVSTYVRDIHKEHEQDGILTLSQLQHYMGFEVQMWEHGLEAYANKVWPVLTAFSARFWMTDYLLLTTDMDIVRNAFHNKTMFDLFLQDTLLLTKPSSFHTRQCDEARSVARAADKELEIMLSNLADEIQLQTALSNETEWAMWPYVERLKNTQQGLCGARNKIKTIHKHFRQKSLNEKAGKITMKEEEEENEEEKEEVMVIPTFADKPKGTQNDVEEQGKKMFYDRRNPRSPDEKPLLSVPVNYLYDRRKQMKKQQQLNETMY